MSDSHTGAGFLRMPGSAYDNAARRLRQDFLAGRIDIEGFIKQNAWHYPKTSGARFENQVQSYALASVVIDQMWEYMPKDKVEVVVLDVAANYRGKSHTERVQGFNACFLAVLNSVRDRFVEERVKACMADTSAPPSKDFEHLTCYFAVSRRRHTHLKGFGLPSMADLVTMVARSAEVAPVVFERDCGRPLYEGGLFSILRHPYLMRLFVEIMSNDRRSTHPLFGLLEGSDKSDLNKVSLRYDPDCFEIYQRGGPMCMRIRPELVQEYRSHYEKAATRRNRSGKADPKVLGCPALYTGAFRDMHEWVLGLFEQWYLATA